MSEQPEQFEIEPEIECFCHVRTPSLTAHAAMHEILQRRIALTALLLSVDSELA